MGAKKLQPVQIMCELSQSQIEELVAMVSKQLPSNPSYVSDIDEPVFGSYRMCVDFDPKNETSLNIVDVAILDKDWELLEEDTAVFKSYLKSIITDYNNRSKESKKQSKQILRDRREYAYL